jgi:hypothetical protein
MCLLDDLADLPEAEKRAAVEHLSRLLRVVPVNLSEPTPESNA